MHLSSIEHMKVLIETYLDRKKNLKVFDLGSYDVNGSYRPLFQNPVWNYQGIDLTDGPNVDIVLKSAYRLPLPSRSADVIISGQAFEHIEFFWLTWLEMVRVLKPGGLIFLLAPSRGPEHRYPLDCWRFYPDAYRALARYASLELLEVSTDWQDSSNAASALWGDTVGAFRKRVNESRNTLKNRLLTLLIRFFSPSE